MIGRFAAVAIALCLPLAAQAQNCIVTHYPGTITAQVECLGTPPSYPAGGGTAWQIPLSAGHAPQFGADWNAIAAMRSAQQPYYPSYGR